MLPSALIDGDERRATPDGASWRGHPLGSMPVAVLITCSIPLAAPITRYASLDRPGEPITGPTMVGAGPVDGTTCPVWLSTTTNAPDFVTPKTACVWLSGVGVGVAVAVTPGAAVGASATVGVAVGVSTNGTPVASDPRKPD